MPFHHPRRFTGNPSTRTGPLFFDHTVRVYVCVPFTQLLLCCWPIRSFRAESHRTHERVAPHRSLPPFSFPSDLFLPSHRIGSPFEILPFLSVSLTCGWFLRPQGPQADSPGRLTELTVSTAGWLRVANHLPSLTSGSQVEWSLPGVTCQPAASVHSRHFEQPVRRLLRAALLRL